MSTKELTPEEKEEQEDKRRLMEAEHKIEEILSLISENNSRLTSNEKLEQARLKMGIDMDGEESERLTGHVFHLHKGKRIPLKLRNSRLLDIIEALELQLKTHSHGEDLQKALTGQAMRKVKLLEKALKRLTRK